VRYNKYLIEYSDEIEDSSLKRSKSISKDKFYSLFKKNCMNSLKSPPIYRGVKGSDEEYLYINPRGKERVSRYTANWYILIMRLLKCWDEYPDLGFSLIGSLSESGAHGWSDDVYRVFPL